jgi:hypothetical protein
MNQNVPEADFTLGMSESFGILKADTILPTYFGRLSLKYRQRLTIHL